MPGSRFDRLGVRELALGVFGVAFLLRLVFLADIRDNPFFGVPVIDAEYYHHMARELAGPGISPAPFQMPPGWPLLLSILYRITGVSLGAAHFLQILIGAGTAAIAFLLGNRLGGRWVGLLAGLLVATSKALLFLEADVLAAPFGVLLDTAAIYFLVRWAQDGEKRRDLVLSGLLLGLSCIVVPVALIAWLPLAVWIGWRRKRWIAAAVFAAAVAVPIVPVTLRNLVTSKEFVLISANGGINLWMGNNPEWRHTSTLRPGPEWRAMQSLPLREAGLVESSARDRWFTRQAIREWTSRPVQSLVRTVQKVILLTHAHEIMRDFDYYVFRDRFSWVLRFPGWNFALLFGLAVAGLLFARRRVAGEGAVHVFAASYAVAVVLTFVTARYRAPLLPFLAVFAAQAVVWIVQRWRAGARQPAMTSAAVATALFVLSTVDILGVDGIDTVEADYRIATTYEKRGLFEEALQRYDAVLERSPEHALAMARGGVCLQYLGRAQEAVDRYERLLEHHPDYAEAAVNLGNLAASHGDVEAAAHYFETAIEADPFLPQAYAAYGVFLLQRGDADAATDALQIALQYDPTWEALRVEYARALLAAGNLDAARTEIDRATRILPPSEKVQLVRGDVLAAAGDRPGARAAYEEGLRLAPSDPELLARMGRGPAPSGTP